MFFSHDVVSFIIKINQMYQEPIICVSAQVDSFFASILADWCVLLLSVGLVSGKVVTAKVKIRGSSNDHESVPASQHPSAASS